MSRIPGAEPSILPLHLERTARIAEIHADLTAFDGRGARHEPHRARLRVGSIARLELFPGEVHEFIGIRMEEGVGGATTWVGQNRDRADSQALVTVNKARIYASIDVGLDRYLVESLADGSVIARQLDGQDNGVCATGDHPDDESYRSHLEAHPTVGLASSVPAHRTIDLMVLYSAEAAYSYNGDMSGVVSNLAASLNTAFSNSGVNGAVRVVHFGLLNGSPNPNRVTEFRNVRNAMINQSSAFSGLHALRDQHGADLVVLLTQRPSGPGDDQPTNPADPTTYPACGAAGGPDQLPLYAGDFAVGGFDVSKAFAVIAVNCADTDRTFHHELAHNLGGSHDAALTGGFCGFGSTAGQDGSSCGFTDPSFGIRTIMGSIGQSPGFPCTVGGCPRSLRFSMGPNPIWIDHFYYYYGSPLAHFSATLESLPLLTFSGSVELVASYRSPPFSAPGTPPGISASSCFASHEISWSASSGTVGWYEVQKASGSSFAGASEIYRGSARKVSVYSSATFYARVRACNGSGCSGWRSSGAIASSSCL